MSRTLFASLIFASALLPLSVAVTYAQNSYYTTGTYTIDVARSVLGSAYMGEDSSGSYTDNMGHPYNPTVNLVTGGQGGFFLSAYNSSTVNVSGGSVGFALTSSDNSTVNVSSGSIGYGLYAYDSSTVNFSGGSIGHILSAINNSTVNVSGGSVGSGGLDASYSSNVTISGGTFGQSVLGVNFTDATSGKFTFVGNNLMATNVGTNAYLGGMDYNLSGTLQDGTNLAGYVLNVQNGSTFNFQPAAVPELSTMLGFGSFVALGGLATFRQRKTARKAARASHTDIMMFIVS